MQVVPAKQQGLLDNNSEHRVRNISHQVWAKPLQNGTIAVLVVNRNVNSLEYVVDFSTLHFPMAKDNSSSSQRRIDSYRVRNVYDKKDVVGIFEQEYTTPVLKPHDSIMLLLTPVVSPLATPASPVLSPPVVSSLSSTVTTDTSSNTGTTSNTSTTVTTDTTGTSGTTRSSNTGTTGTTGTTSHPHPLSTLVRLTDYPNAVCLDGTAAGYYVRSATTHASKTKFVLHHEGGGWCQMETPYQTWVSLNP